MSSPSRRTQIINDQIVQGELMFRAIVYWFFCLLIIELLVLAWAMLTGPPQTLAALVRESLGVSAPAAFGMILLLPFILVDVLKVSNRFVGPIQSVRATMRQLSDGVPARRVYLRRDDFWHELAHYTNLVADKIETVDWEDDGVEDLEDADEEKDIPCTDRVLHSEFENDDVGEDELDLVSEEEAFDLEPEFLEADEIDEAVIAADDSAADESEGLSDSEELDFTDEPHFEAVESSDADANEEEAVEV